MDLTKEVTAFFPEEGMPGSYTVGIHLKLMDGAETVIDQDFTQQWGKGQDVPASVALAIGKKAQEAIDSYIARKALGESAKYQAKVSQIDAGLKLGD